MEHAFKLMIIINVNAIMDTMVHYVKIVNILIFWDILLDFDRFKTILFFIMNYEVFFKD